MGLVYRAIWQDDRDDLVEVAHEAFEAWARSKYHVIGGIPEGSTPISLGGLDLVTEHRRAAEGALTGLEDTLTEDRGHERWRTRLRVLIDEERGEQWLWVDLDRVTEDPFSIPKLAAPRLVRELLTGGLHGDGNPRVGPARLGVDAFAVPPDRVGTEIVDLIAHPERETPVLVFSHHEGDSPELTMERARRAAEILAGVATVHVLPPHSEAAFESGVGRELGVWAGAARLYLPGDLAPWRHRYLTAEVVGRRPREAGERFARLLARFVPARRAPGAYAKVRPLLRRVRADTDADLLELALIEIDEKNQRIDELQRQLQEAEDCYVDAVADQEEIELELARERHKVRDLRRRLDGGGDDVSPGWELPAIVESVSEAVELARRHLEHVVVPEEACRDLDKLDAALESCQWANAIWRGLRALDAYARDAAGFAGGFWEWCEHAGAVDTWPATTKKLAMRESETVMSNERLRRCRELPVDRRIDPSGRILMEAHLKIAEGGGDLAPRIYFHDDTKGPTGRVHVGFVGPHHHLPNTKT